MRSRSSMLCERASARATEFSSGRRSPTICASSRGLIRFRSADYGAERLDLEGLLADRLEHLTVELSELRRREHLVPAWTRQVDLDLALDPSGPVGHHQHAIRD